VSNEPSIEQMLHLWKFQDTYHDAAIEMVSRGAHLGALAMAKYIALANATHQEISNEQLLALVKLAHDEVREDTKENLNKLRGN
jgi:hypothetical protein